MRILQKYGLLLAVVLAMPLLLVNYVWAQSGELELENTIIKVSQEADGVIQVSGNITSTQDVGELYIQAILTDKQGITRDRAQSEKALIPGSPYEERFRFGLTPIVSDRIVLMTVTRDGIPLDIDPLQIKWSDDTPEVREADILDIISCEYQESSQEINCYYQGTLNLQEVTVRLYDGQPYIATRIVDTIVPVRKLEEEGQLSFSAFAQPEKDGLYIYTITNEQNTILYQGSVRTGDIPEIVRDELDTDQEKQDQQRFLMILGALSLAFFTAVMMLSQFLLNPKKTRWIWIGVGALILAFLSVWYVAYAATYQSTNYSQYRYTVSTDLSSTQTDGSTSNTYIVSFSAFDTYRGNPPRNQQVDITSDGINYRLFINDRSGQPVHVKEVVINDMNKNSSAIKVRNGCGSYYGFSTLGSDVYGNYDCAPYPLSFKAAIVGCLDPSATNYNPQATTDDGSCVISGCTNPNADNYNANATTDNGSCVISGCTNSSATNYNANATTDDGSCQILGCTSPDSPNYNARANVDDGSCIACVWSPIIPDPSTFCTTESYYQTNNCTNEIRSVRGNLDSKWLPEISPSDICVGSFVTQTDQCSPLINPPTRTIEGTSNSPSCFAPITEFEVSTNLINWTSCEEIGRIQMTRPDQGIYLRGSGTEPVGSWEISQDAGEISGTVIEHEGSIWKAQFEYLVEKKQFDNVAITMTSPAGNTSTQMCNFILLNFDFQEQ